MANPYVFVSNDPIGAWDFLGLKKKKRDDQWILDYFVKPFVEIEKAFITATQTVIGVPFSILSGDIASGFQDVSSLEKDKCGCDFLITINGIWNNDQDKYAILEQSFKKIYNKKTYDPTKDFNVIAITNMTGAINNKTPGSSLATGGILDLIQITGHELGGIDNVAINVARAINKAQEVGERNCCKTITIRVVAHTQGTMAFMRSIGYIGDKAQNNIQYQGFGGQAFISGYGFKARIVRNDYDPVPNIGPHNSVNKSIKGEQWEVGPGVGHGWINYSSAVKRNF